MSYFYFTAVLEETKNREIEMGTIIEGSRLEMEKDMELVIVQTTKEKVDLYEELGFVFIPKEKLV